MILLTVISAMILSIHARAAVDMDLCQSLVIQRVAEADTDAPPLSELKEHLPDDGGATVLFRLDLESINPSLDLLSQATQGGDSLEVPVRVFGENSLIFLAQGPVESLLKLRKRLADKNLEEHTTFYLLSPKGSKPLGAPRALVHGEEEFERALTNEDGFAVYVAHQIVFVLPRTVFDEYGLAQLNEAKINVSHSRRTPASWTDWLSKRSDDFKAKTIILAGDRAIVSSSAFSKLQEVTGLDEDVSPAMLALNKKILDVLEEPPARKARRKASARSADDSTTSERLTKPVRKIIMGYLSEHRGRTRLNESGGLERAFLALAKTLPNDRAIQKYRQAIREIGFSAWEYTSLGHNTDLAIDRVIQGWRAYLKAAKNPYADLELNASNTREAIKHLGE